MALTFGKLGVPQATYYVQKTGFPFYDACQLVGAMHLFFGSGTSSLKDCGSYWILAGEDLRREAEQISVMGGRLLGKGLERVEQTTLTALAALDEHFDEIQSYYSAPFPKVFMTKQEGVSRYLEPSYLTGARGSDASAYVTLASQRGVSTKRPTPEIKVATAGLTQAAIAYGNDEVFTVLPVLRNSLQPLTPFKTYNRTFRHVAGGYPTAVYASLGLLIAFGERYPIQDFAYAFHGGRGFYHGGLLGLGALCGRAKRGLTSSTFVKQAFNYLQRTSSSDPGLPLDLARSLSHFLQNSAVETLAVIVGTKARLISDEEQPRWVRGAAAQLFGSEESIKEVLFMTHIKSINVPPPSEGVVEAVGEVFRAEKEGRWIGSYIQLERAHDPEKFYGEVGKILSRAMSRAEGNKDQPWLFPRLRKAMAKLSSEEVLTVFEQKNHFTAHKVTFLLRVLGAMHFRPSAQSREGTEQLVVSPEGEEA